MWVAYTVHIESELYFQNYYKTGVVFQIIRYMDWSSCLLIKRIYLVKKNS